MMTCGNAPYLNGFYPCNLDGKVVEPTEKDWDGIHYKCDLCGNIINQDTLEVIKQVGV